MNRFSQLNKNPENKLCQRVKIKSKYFGEYEPQLFIASKSKSKSKSTPKDQINNFLARQTENSSHLGSLDTQNQSNANHANLIQTQTLKSPLSYNSASLSQYLLSRNVSPRTRKPGTGIEKIIEWVERKYHEKLINNKIQKQSSLSLIRQNLKSFKDQNKKFQENFKKIIYNLYILSKLKLQRKATLQTSSLLRLQLPQSSLNTSFESKQHDIDKIQLSPLKQNFKAEDFDIFKFKKNVIYTSDKNLSKITQISSENNIKVGIKNESKYNWTQKDVEFYDKKYNSIPTMGTLQSLDDNKMRASIKQITETFNQDDSLISDKKINKKQALQSGDTNKSTIVDFLIHPDLKPSQVMILNINKKLKNQIQVCDIDYWPNVLFHHQKLPQTTQPLELNPINTLIQNASQILNQIFEMNDNQQQILKTLKQKKVSIELNQQKELESQSLNIAESIINEIENLKSEDSQLKQKVSPADNYFSMHLSSGEPKINQIQTYEMPLAKAKTNMAIKFLNSNPSSSYLSKNLLNQNDSPNKEVFTFNSLNPQSQVKPQCARKKTYHYNKPKQKNAFAPKCNLFRICGQQKSKQLQRTNYLTDMSTSIRQRETSANSNKSKTSSKPKVNFKYLSPSSNNFENLQKEQNNSILFKSQSSHLKNTGLAPVKIQIKNSRQSKGDQEKKLKQFQLYNMFKTDLSPINQNRQFKYQSHAANSKLRSQSVPHFIVQKQAMEQANTHRLEQELKYQKSKKIQHKNGFVSAGYGPFYQYQFQKYVPHIDTAYKIQPNYNSVQSHYFSGANQNPSKIIQTTRLSNKPLIKQNELAIRKNHRYLYPVQNTIEKQRNQRARSLCEKICVTLRKGKC